MTASALCTVVGAAAALGVYLTSLPRRQPRAVSIAAELTPEPELQPPVSAPVAIAQPEPEPIRSRHHHRRTRHGSVRDDSGLLRPMFASF